MQIGVSTWSFQQLLQSGKETQISVIALAKRLGFAAIEFVDITPMNGMTQAQTAERIREESDRVGLPIVNYTIGADFLAKDANAEAERLCGQVDVARILGAVGLRHDATGGWALPADKKTKTFAQALPILADGCRAVSAYAEQHGIATMVENHGYFCQDSLRLAALVAAVGTQNFGALADIGNFCCADEEPAVAVGNVAPFVKHVHAKDFIIKSGDGQDPGEGFSRSRAGNYLRGTIVGHGGVPVRQCLQTLQRAGYRGYVNIEFEGIEPCEDALRVGLENLRGYIA
ncbi:MAG: sugar phosphate isomerase/epimerase [Oscillospiraceae bacterium]|jgi:sugar phosphate isomerase/epimerase|nr:sugar phosphate isomerase/epimerase [Oscillospiraceae bacterium]